MRAKKKLIKNFTNIPFPIYSRAEILAKRTELVKLRKRVEKLEKKLGNKLK